MNDPSPSSGATTARLDRAWLVVLLAATFLVFWKSTALPFTNYDDPQYLFMNPEVRKGLSWETFSWGLTALHADISYWHPISWWSHMMDVELFGMQPGPHHVTSLLLHAANVVVLFFWLRTLTGPWQAGAAALVFSIHPTAVETVAWVAERKSLLSSLFGFAALLCYSRYCRSPNLRRYLLALLWFGLSLMAKPMLVTLPALLLLLDYTVAPRSIGAREIWLEKVPFFLVSAGIAALTMLAQSEIGAIWSAESLPVAARIANAFVSVCRYLSGLLAPRDLRIFYPHPLWWHPVRVILSVGLVVTITTWIAFRCRRYPWLAFGWSWFLISLLPVIGLVQVGRQAMADRYCYWPLVGLTVAGVWAANRLVEPLAGARRTALSACGIAWVVALGGLSFRQLDYWRDPIELWRRSAVKSEASYFPCAVYGQMLVSAQEYESAFGFLLDAALDASAEENTAVWLRAASAARLAGRANEARGMLRRILGANEPEFRGEAFYEMGLLEEEAGKPDRALANFGRALSSSPPFEGAAIPLTQTLLMNARDPEDFRRARQLAKRAGITTTDEASARMLLGVSTWLAGDRATGTKILGEVFEREKEFRSNTQILAARRLLLEATVATTHDDLIRSWRRADRRLQTLLTR